MDLNLWLYHQLSRGNTAFGKSAYAAASAYTSAARSLKLLRGH